MVPKTSYKVVLVTVIPFLCWGQLCGSEFVIVFYNDMTQKPASALATAQHSCRRLFPGDS
jgi:hypothetical protein